MLDVVVLTLCVIPLLQPAPGELIGISRCVGRVIIRRTSHCSDRELGKEMHKNFEGRPFCVRCCVAMPDEPTSEDLDASLQWVERAYF
jgi:hypothetical protein